MTHVCARQIAHAFKVEVYSSFGGSVSISGRNVAVGATEVVDNTQGAAYVLATVRATTITSSAIKSATIGRKYAYQVKTNADGSQTITFSLGAAPAGMSINASTGLVNWVPNVFQTGSSTVTVRATDQFGDTAQQTFSISVSGIATPHNPFARVFPVAVKSFFAAAIARADSGR